MRSYRSYYGVFFILMICSSMLFAKSHNDKIKQAQRITKSDSPSSAQSDVYYLNEDWESGFGTWTTNDETDIGIKWNLSTWNAYGGAGESWRMADSTLGTNGGYNNSWYQVLDTDPIALTGTGQQLTFYHRYAVETPGGEPAGYDAWDGINVRISTDNGTSWEVLQNPIPAYTSASLYSFGFEHNEGKGIAGWGGTLADWTLVTFDLSAYANQNIMIRFAFGSDPEYSTPDNSSLFGWQIDDIAVTNSTSTLFSNDGTSSGFTAKNNTTIGGNLWRIASDNPFAGLYFASCNNDSNTYLPNMQNALTSDNIFLDTMATDIYLDFNLKGTFSDNNTFPDVDYFGAYVQVEGESSRRFISNITQDPNGNNYVYSDAPASWALFSNTYSTGLVNLTSLKGKNIKVIFEFESDADSAMGSGLQIDNAVIYTPKLVAVNDNNSNSFPNKFTLEQNYPNPFNPSTKVRYSIPALGTSHALSVQLKVYDVLGNEIATLVNKEQQPGNYEIDFNASGLSSGMYFYTLTTGSFSSTKKMILMK